MYIFIHVYIYIYIYIYIFCIYAYKSYEYWLKEMKTSCPSKFNFLTWPVNFADFNNLLIKNNYQSQEWAKCDYWVSGDYLKGKHFIDATMVPHQILRKISRHSKTFFITKEHMYCKKYTEEDWKWVFEKNLILGCKNAYCSFI